METIFIYLEILFQVCRVFVCLCLFVQPLVLEKAVLQYKLWSG